MKTGRIFPGMLGMLAVTLILGMTIVGCGGGGGGGGGSTPPNGSGGTFTLTGIPAQYNGMYTFLWVDDLWEVDAVYTIIGCQPITNQTGKRVRISDGKVNIPMIAQRNNTYGLYSGNDSSKK